MQWLDVARYADTNGYQTDGERHMWRWREWVIDAFNSNKSFRDFTIEQLAGDLLMPLPSRCLRRDSIGIIGQIPKVVLSLKNIWLSMLWTE